MVFDVIARTFKFNVNIKLSSLKSHYLIFPIIILQVREVRVVPNQLRGVPDLAAFSRVHASYEAKDKPYFYPRKTLLARKASLITGYPLRATEI